MRWGNTGAKGSHSRPLPQLTAADAAAIFEDGLGGPPGSAFGRDCAWDLMAQSEYFARLGAAVAAAALCGLAIANPRGAEQAAMRAAEFAPDAAPMATKVCALGEQPFTAAFADINDIVSVSPLGGVTAPGEQLPAPYIRLNTKSGESAFERRMTAALAPGRADITAIERRVKRNDAGEATGERWTLYFSACEDIAFAYDDLDSIDPAILARAGGLKEFAEIGGADHLAVATEIRVKPGDTLGLADGFDVFLTDRGAPPAALDRPERYKSDPYAHAAAIDAAPALLKAIDVDIAQARCPLDYLPEKLADEWQVLLGDAFGMRKAKGEGRCRAALVDVKGTAQGAWFTDAAHNGLTRKVSAVALAPDAVDPSRLIFSLHGRLKSLNADMIGLNPMLEEEREAAARDFLTFDVGEGRINLPFDRVKPGVTYCYENLRANFVGPKINGVILLELSAEGRAPLMRIEARDDATSCIDIEDPWTFSSKATTFYR
jgi:hypothetical protein